MSDENRRSYYFVACRCKGLVYRDTETGERFDCIKGHIIGPPHVCKRADTQENSHG